MPVTNPATRGEHFWPSGGRAHIYERPPGPANPGGNLVNATLPAVFWAGARLVRLSKNHDGTAAARVDARQGTVPSREAQ